MRIRLLATVLVVGGISSVMAAGSAQAAVIANPVTAITVTPANPRLTDPVRTDIVWCVPESATAGDTFQVALPSQLVQLPSNFNLRDPAGVLVATAVIAGVPAIVTFTFNDYVDTHTNVCGTAFFESRLDSSLTPGTSVTLTYVVNGTLTFQPVINILPGAILGGRDVAKKGGFFGNPNDECRTVAEGCLGWFIESQVGPFQSITVIDTAPVGTTFVCSQLSARLWSVDAAGALVAIVPSASVGATLTTTCSPGSLQVVGTNIPAGVLMRVVVRATPQVLDPAGGVTFVNAATVTHVLPNQTVDVDSITGQRRSSRVGGDANGVNVPAATTTTTVAAAPPVVPSTTTTIVAVLLPLPPTTLPTPAGPGPQLPATGSNGELLAVGTLMLLTGGFLLVISATRRRQAV